MRSNKPLRLFRLWDVVLIAILLVLVAFCVYFAIAPKQGESAEIYIDGKLFRSVPLSKNAVIELDHLKVIVSRGKVHVEHADCPDKLCEKRGSISRSGESIVCLPNRIVIKITGKDEVEAIS